jgi:hypothetical protein
MAPGIAFRRTDVSDYGSSLGVAMPLDWVMADGLRIGLELDLGRAFGGSYHLVCSDNSGLGMCAGSEITQDRPQGTAVALQFQLGFGFNHPDPLPASPAPSPSASWPSAAGAPPPLTPSAPPTPSAAPAPSVPPTG